MIRSLTAISVFIFCVDVSYAAAPLSDASEVNHAFKFSENIHRATVLSKREEWVAGGTIITKVKATSIIKAFSDYQDRHIEIFGLADGSDEAKAHWDDFWKTDNGRLFKSLERTKVFVSLRLTKLLKGKPPKNQIVTCAWTTSHFDSCPHVGVSTNIGDKVTIFLKKEWSNQVVVNPSLFLIGSSLLNPSTKQGSAHQSTTRSESKSE